MMIIKLFYVLHKIGMLHPSAIYRLGFGIFTYGINLMALLYFSSQNHKDRIAFIDEHETCTYDQLFVQSVRLATVLKNQYKLETGKKTGILCKNHASLVKTIFAISSTGADIHFLHTEMSEKQLSDTLTQLDLDLLVYDEEYEAKLEQTAEVKAKLLSYHETLPSIHQICSSSLAIEHVPTRESSGKLVLQTGGTTGKPKEANHQPSLFHYLNPFEAFITRLHILQRHTAYIATPIYHGYGLAVMLLFLALGKKVIVRRSFDAANACCLIRDHQVDTVTVVPTMLHKMLKTNANDLKTLVCIASGGAELNPTLVKETLATLGPVLFNLYGTTEAGLNVIATPNDLMYDARTIGRKIHGVKIKVFDENKKEAEPGRVGQLHIKNRWSIRNRTSSWIKTGDMGYVDENGYYFLSGRVDQMIVSGGENVFPLEVEHIVLEHPQVSDAAIIGVKDEVFGQRLLAFVVLTRDQSAELNPDDLKEWLGKRLARYQMPKEIIFVEQLPYTSLGKLDRNRLQTTYLH